MTEIRDIHQVIEVLFAQLAAMRKEVELLTKENVQLRERLSRYEHPKDSHNGNLPLSKEKAGQPSSKDRQIKRRAKRTSGKNA